MPKVHRIVLALTANETYVGYWNYVSEIWRTKFDVTPTLIFYGTKAELQECRLSRAYGDIVRLDPIAEVTLNRQRDWACTWGLFYGASLFPDDICMLSGIDQIPLSGMFFDMVRRVPDWKDKYLVGFADAYGGSYFPSSHHVARGNLFQAVYSIETDWAAELKKVYATRLSWTTVASDAWGLDEAYSSSFLRRRELDQNDVVRMLLFNDYWQPARIDRRALTPNDFARIADGRHSEWHGLRPFEANNADLMRQLKEAIPVYSWAL